ncbi:Uncharacterized protein YhaN [Geosporobacter subterraneus DSM 17957]|uniref:Uncharacterized protein YhaN n=1 Tax=Geosporobacter subterraneus DSM 17957 TaxID=1121919 RepID=A0A1M6N995_9FIRM|nr:AAA family ATPase [Geosporobacter subterraneus]SHJ92136.1 Uncharacterized protein YhaN [Geosporobacter subterraneus DSM 17957]
MIIKKVKIGRFGKLKDKEIDFQRGLNLIYGENEAGKSTLQAFIKAMLYGMGSGKKDIRENDRKRYLPWSGEDAAGELYFEDAAEQEYLIKRRFGEKKKKDDRLVIDCISGEEAVHIDAERPGLTLLGIGEEAFEKTIFIRQLGSEVARDKEDEIMKRISNLQQTGDESLSYHKAVDALQRAGKALQSPRKTGRLDKLKAEQDRLRQELVYTKSLHTECIEEQLQLNRLQEEREILIKQIARLEDKKKAAKLALLKEEYEQLCDYERQIQEKLQTIARLEQSLNHKGYQIDGSWIAGTREKLHRQKELQKNYLNIEEQQKSLQSRLKEQKALLEELGGYKDLDEDIELKLFEILQEKQNLEQKRAEIEALTEEKKFLERQLQNEKESLGRALRFEEVPSNLEIEIYDREDRVKELKNKIAGDTRRDHLLLKQDMIKDKQKTTMLLLLAGVAAMAGGAAAGWFINTLLYGLGALGLLLCILGFVRKGKLAGEVKKLEMEISVFGDTKELHKELEDNLRELQQIYIRFGVMNLQEFRSGMLRYTEKRENIEILNVKIGEKKKQLEGFLADEIQEKLSRCEHFIGEIYDRCGCQDYEAFKQGLKQYRKLLSDQENIENKLGEVSDQLHRLQEELDQMAINIGEAFALIGKTFDEFEKDEQLIEEISTQLQQQKEEKVALEALENTYEALLKGRSLSQMGEEMAAAEAMSEIQAGETEELLENALRESTQQLIIMERRIRDLEYGIQSRLQGVRTITGIEEELEGVRQQISYYEEVAISLDIGKEVLEQAFKEIQRSFGPRFNKTVGEILGKITVGKYSEVKISEDYQVKVSDSMEDKIKDIDYFSNGTWDQIYFALRLGITEMIFGKEATVPIFLDDAFVQYDEERLKAVLEYLYDYGKQHQVILFTCQRREVEVLQQYSDVNFIYL